ncbi:MAG: acetyl-CoA carboxylase carboxyltransferase subunit alpha [Thermoleophilia bacterium]|nr:acetyl-CoA carboxylase carboxyltransferase subunit alpha [Thermoleophilia bacterium]
MSAGGRDHGGRFVRRLAEKLHRQHEPPPDDLWASIQLARHAERPYTLDYINRLCSDFEEVHGDRLSGDDPALVAGFGRFNDRPVAMIGQQKGRDTKERTYRNFGMASPEGYRKAMRVMEIANRLGIPVVTLIDTPGAFPGASAEEHGQGGAISRSIQMMWRLEVPTIAVIIGEGSSGGALGLGVADRVLMLENGTYSVISPEGASAILWRDASKARLAAQAFKPTAANCYSWGVVDAVVPEPVGGAHTNHDHAAEILGQYIQRALTELAAIPAEDRRHQRRERFRRLGSLRDPDGGMGLVTGRDAVPTT